MAKKLRIGVIFGGRSGEHEVSIRSARSVVEAIDRTKYEVVPIAITEAGKWLSPSEASALLPETARTRLSGEVLHSEPGPVAIVGDPSQRGLLSMNSHGLGVKSQRLDVVFPVLHGPFGEDGTVQGLLEMANVPYVGCGVLASACGMDKVTMKTLFVNAGLPICKHVWFLRSHWRQDQPRILRGIRKELGTDYFVKPANLGSSVGISHARRKAELIAAVDLAARYDRKIIVEEAIDGREIECAVMGNDEPQASLPGEYVLYDESAKFLDYEEKYSSTGHVEFVVPAPISKSDTKKLQKMAIRAFQAIDGAGLSRVDFFWRRDTGELLINELNTLPGLTDVSGYPKMWEASGIGFRELIDRLITLAIERHQDKAKNKISR